MGKIKLLILLSILQCSLCYAETLQGLKPSGVMDMATATFTLVDNSKLQVKISSSQNHGTNIKQDEDIFYFTLSGEDNSIKQGKKVGVVFDILGHGSVDKTTGVMCIYPSDSAQTGNPLCLSAKGDYWSVDNDQSHTTGSQIAYRYNGYAGGGQNYPVRSTKKADVPPGVYSLNVQTYTSNQ